MHIYLATFLSTEKLVICSQQAHTNTYACTHIYMQNAHKLTPRAYEYSTDCSVETAQGEQNYLEYRFRAYGFL